MMSKPKPDDTIIDTRGLGKFLKELAAMLEICGTVDDKAARLIAQTRQCAADLPKHKKSVHKIRARRRKLGYPEELTWEEICGEVLYEKTLTELCEALTERMEAILEEINEHRNRNK